MKDQEQRTQVADLFRRFGVLLGNGVPMLSALEALAADSPQESLILAAKRMRQAVEVGRPFWEGLHGTVASNSELLRRLSKAAEQGRLDNALAEVADALERGAYSETAAQDEQVTVDGELADPQQLDLRLKELLSDAHRAGASDLHLETTHEGGRLRLRLDGVLHTRSPVLSSEETTALISRIKSAAGLDPAERRLPQDGRILMSFDSRSQTRRLDVRVAVAPYVIGEKVVLRFLDASRFPDTLEGVMDSEKAETIRGWTRSGFGIIIVTGPTGSGKTTTLLLALSELAAKGSSNVVSIEDPVEVLLPGVNQLQVDRTIGLTFRNALMTVMRQDPDVVMLGEIVDEEAAQLAAQVAFTGHLLLTQLHSADTVGAVGLLRDLGIKPHLLRELLRGVVAQRLVRRLCPNCKREMSVEQRASLLAELARQDAPIFGPVGCDECANTGYKGRMALYELLQPNANFWSAVFERDDLIALGRNHNSHLVTLWQDGKAAIAAGLTSPAEVCRVLGLEELGVRSSIDDHQSTT